MHYPNYDLYWLWWHDKQWEKRFHCEFRILGFRRTKLRGKKQLYFIDLHRTRLVNKWMAFQLRFTKYYHPTLYNNTLQMTLTLICVAIEQLQIARQRTAKNVDCVGESAIKNGSRVLVYHSLATRSHVINTNSTIPTGGNKKLWSSFAGLKANSGHAICW